LKVTGLRLPEDGVNWDLEQVAKVQVITSKGLTPWRRFNKLQYVRALYNSTISFSENKRSSVVMMNVTFGASVALKPATGSAPNVIAADSVKITLPGIDVCTNNANLAVCTSTATPVIYGTPNCAFLYAWDNVNSVLTLTPTAMITKHTICTSIIRYAMVKDAGGFPTSSAPTFEVSAMTAISLPGT